MTWWWSMRRLQCWLPGCRRRFQPQWGVALIFVMGPLLASAWRGEQVDRPPKAGEHAKVLAHQAKANTSTGLLVSAKASLLQQRASSRRLQAVRRVHHQLDQAREHPELVGGNGPSITIVFPDFFGRGESSPGAGESSRRNPIMRILQGAAQTQAGSGKSTLVSARDFAGYFDDIKFTVIRIQAITAEVNWFQPYQQPQDMLFVGSGMAVVTDDSSATDPVFLTNAHVVKDAHQVQVQLPAIGQRFFDAYVPLICEEFDLAIVQLHDPEEFFKALQAAGDQKIKALKVESLPLILGLQVASVGFPLGSTALKLSEGIISGTEEVGDFICYQTTAPISPGSSGGPLFALNTDKRLQVIGVTFASAASKGAQNTNYVVPAVSVVQVIDEFMAQKAKWSQVPDKTELDVHSLPGGGRGSEVTQGQSPRPAEVPLVPNPDSHDPGPPPPKASREDIRSRGSGPVDPHVESPVGPSKVDPTEQQHTRDPPEHHRVKWMKPDANKGKPHYQFRIAPVDTLGIEANEVLYKEYKCTSGVFLSRILNTSVFKKNTVPPVEDRSFLLEVDGVTLDSFGMGRTKDFLGDPTPFESLMMMKAREQDQFDVKICKDGAEQSHTVKMTWSDEKYEQGIKDVEEPHFDSEAMRWEIFAGVTLMQMSVQHVIKLIQAGFEPTVGRWLLPESRQQPHLIITHVEKGTYASRVLNPGMVVSKVNGKPVSTMKEYAAAFMPDGEDPWVLETERGIIFAIEFREALVEQFERATKGQTYLLTEALFIAATGGAPPSSPAGKQVESVDATNSANKTTPLKKFSYMTGLSAGDIAEAIRSGTGIFGRSTPPYNMDVLSGTGLWASGPSLCRHCHAGSADDVAVVADASARFSGFAKADAFAMSAAGLDEESRAVEARRRARAARAGFLVQDGTTARYHGSLSSFVERTPLALVGHDDTFGVNGVLPRSFAFRGQ